MDAASRLVPSTDGPLSSELDFVPTELFSSSEELRLELVRLDCRVNSDDDEDSRLDVVLRLDLSLLPPVLAELSRELLIASPLRCSSARSMRALRLDVRLVLVRPRLSPDWVADVLDMEDADEGNSKELVVFPFKFEVRLIEEVNPLAWRSREDLVLMPDMMLSLD